MSQRPCYEYCISLSPHWLTSLHITHTQDLNRLRSSHNPQQRSSAESLFSYLGKGLL